MMRAALCGLVVWCFVSPAQAGMVTVTDTRSVSDDFLFTGNGSGSLGSGGNLNFTLPQYNLGFPLLGVEVEYEVLNFSLEISLTNLSSSETAIFNVGENRSRSGPFFPGVLTVPFSFGSSGVGILGPGESQIYTGAITGPFSAIIAPLFFPDYTGSGAILTGPNFNRSVSVSGLTGLTDPDDLLAQGSLSASVRATITYTFDEAVVPEPSSLMLLGIGGLALAGYGWRRKRRLAA